MVRRFALVVAALAVLALAHVPVPAGAAAGAPKALASAEVKPKDVISGSTANKLTFSVQNLAEVPLTVIRIVRPSTRFAITGASAGIPWTASTSAPDSATFNGFLPPAATASLSVTVDAATTATDVTDTLYWTVLVSTSSGQTYEITPGKNNAPWRLSANIRVLQPGRVVLAPTDASTVVAGSIVSLSVPLTNMGSATVGIRPSDSKVSSDEPGMIVPSGTLVEPVTIGPGETRTATFTGVEIGTIEGPLHIRLTVADKSIPVLQAAVKVVQVVNRPPQITGANTGRHADGSVAISVYMSERVRGTHNVENWDVVDDHGVRHELVTVTGSGGTIWQLTLAPLCETDFDGTPTITYTPGDLEDLTDVPLPASTVEAADGIAEPNPCPGASEQSMTAPADEPPAEEPPAEEQPPAEEPPAEEAPADQPPAEEAPADQPPAEEPAASTAQ